MSLRVGKGGGTRSDIDLRIDGQVDIDARGALSDAVRTIGNGAGRVSSSTGLPTQAPYIRFRLGGERLDPQAIPRAWALHSRGDPMASVERLELGCMEEARSNPVARTFILNGLRVGAAEP